MWLIGVEVLVRFLSRDIWEADGKLWPGGKFELLQHRGLLDKLYCWDTGVLRMSRLVGKLEALDTLAWCCGSTRREPLAHEDA